MVMKDPAPRVTFEAFGPSSLTRLAVLPARHGQPQASAPRHPCRGDRELRKAGIEIAFPQQDVHVRSIPREPWLSGQVSAVRDDRDGRKARNAA